MLPIMEDPGLAARFADGSYSVQEVLLYSTVCGCGLGKLVMKFVMLLRVSAEIFSFADCVPITGDTPLDALANLLADTATLAHRVSRLSE